MNDPWTISTAAVIAGLAAALAGVCVFLLKKSLEKIEQLDTQCVRKRELKELEERLEKNQREMHGENRATMGEIRSDIRELRNRVDGGFNRGGR